MNGANKILVIIGLAFLGFLGALAILKYSIHYHDGVVRDFSLQERQDSTKYYFFILNLKKDSLLLKPARSSVVVSRDTVLHKASVKAEEGSIKIERADFTFNTNPMMLIWALVFSMMLGTAFGLLLPLWDKIRYFVELFDIRKQLKNVIFIAVPVCAVVIFLGRGEKAPILSAFYVADSFKVLFTNTTGPGIIVTATMLIGCIAISGLLVVNFCIPNIGRLAEYDPKRMASLFEVLNDGLRFFLYTIAVFIVYSIFAYSLLQQALTNEISINGIRKFNVFPPEFIYAYGLIFTIILAIIYLPIDFHLKKEGLELANVILAAENDPHPEKQIQILKNKESGLKNLNIFLTILSPILGSAFSEVIKHISG